MWMNRHDGTAADGPVGRALRLRAELRPEPAPSDHDAEPDKNESTELAGTFNTMASELASRDVELGAAQLHLEARVLDRTVELQRARDSLEAEVIERRRA